MEAELPYSAEDFPAARRAVTKLVEEEPDARSLTIMAAVERGEGASDVVVKGWLARALSAPRGPQLVCDVCQHIHAEWRAICENCCAFDSLSWRAPPEAAVTSPIGVEMLPLIVGAIEDKSDEGTADEADVVEAETIVMPDDGAAENAETKTEEAAKN